MTTALRRVGILIALLASLALLIGNALPAWASPDTLIVAGAPPIHETTLPHLSTISSRLITRPMFESLVGVDPVTWDYSQPMLAERWEMSADSKTWTLLSAPRGALP